MPPRTRIGAAFICFSPAYECYFCASACARHRTILQGHVNSEFSTDAKRTSHAVQNIK